MECLNLFLSQKLFKKSGRSITKRSKNIYKKKTKSKMQMEPGRLFLKMLKNTQTVMKHILEVQLGIVL